MQFLVLGPLEVSSPESPVNIRRGRPRSLLHSLILNRRVVQPVEVLADRLWEEDPPADAANAIHQLVSYLRRTLGAAGRGLLETTATGYRLDVSDESVDAWRMERLVQAAIGATQAKEARLIEQALADATSAIRLWRGEPFAESAHFEWSAGPRARLQDVYLQAQESRIDAMLALGQHREVVLETQSLSAAYPLRERFHAQLALALYRTGRQSEALEAHRAVRELLARELGLDPGNELRELERAILNQDPSLDWMPLAGAVEVTPRPAAIGDEGAAEPELDGPPPPHRLTVPPFEIVGRDTDIKRAAEGASPGVIYTLTGPAGVGKTRLALSVAEGKACPVWFVDLDGLSDDSHVAGTVAAALRILNKPGREPHERLVEAMSRADGLLVLDNCEFVVGGVARLAEHLRNGAPRLSMLVTSRRPLGVPGETVHRLTPLEVPPDDVRTPDTLRTFPAVQLWVQRARLVGASPELDDSQWQDVAAIVRGLDGLPMAIEIAAGHADVATTRVIRDRLAARLDSLVAARDSPSGRSPSLTAALEASVAVLDDHERELFYALGTFPGPFEAEAAAYVTDRPTDEAYRMLASLVRQSLVTLDENYRLLAPVRAFALSKAEALLDMDALRDRHARWVAEIAWRSWQETGGLRHTQELGELRPLMTDARVALDWACRRRDLTVASRVAVGFAWVWTLHGRADEGFTWLTQVKELSDEASFEEPTAAISRAAVLRSLGLLANPRGELELARDVCSEASALSLRHGDREGAAAALLTLAVAEWALAHFAESAAAAEQAAELMGARPNSWYYVSSRVLRARTALDAGEPDAAELLEQAVEVSQRADDRHMVGLSLACLARHQLLAGDYAAAAMTAAEALRVWRAIAYTEGEMMGLNILSRVAGAEKDIGKAVAVATEALRIGLRTGHRGACCEAVESLALAAALDGRREQALLMFMLSDRERSRLGAPVPAADGRLMGDVRTQVREALGDAAALVDSRSRITRWDDFILELSH